MLDTGTSAFMLISTMLVALMTPGLAFFYGGLARRKNVINTMLLCVACVGVVGILWVVVGWSIAYGGTGENPFIGGFDQLGLTGLTSEMLTEASDTPGILGMLAAGSSAVGSDVELAYPHAIDVAFQMAFAMISTAIISGAVAGRMKFGPMLIFSGLWVVLVYAPLAHMVWGGDHSFIGAIIGALDFAGGDVVHISSGVSALILCIVLGSRRGFGALTYRPHNVPTTLLGAGLLWFGWFGFNAGSAFAPDGIAALALINTLVASAAASFSWMIVEYLTTKKPTLIGAATGLISGLVVITPAAGFVEPLAAIIMGLIVSPICFWGMSRLKAKLGYDDALDAFGCHGIGGIVGGVLTGVFCVPELSWTSSGGLLYTGSFDLLIAQVLGMVVTIVYVCVTVGIIAFVLKKLCGNSLRVSREQESLGLDVSLHGESAYPSFLGLD